ncbi:helix-turn-helix domain-containing protein [Streptosporangium sp. NBC_01469]|uniref:helix-turn-helix domain-containing protein n=1 Tax=Streptosporangium sp. NBC_01469 TaxID=2903898 RepID=UPI002E2CF0B9|nr:helix-turn-helix transcriptional regulator [Streptosporangium sp. NBC_01469]
MTGNDWNPDLTYDERSEHAGQRIAKARKLRNLTQEGLAGLANVSRSLIAKVESGSRPVTPSLVAAVARACAVDPAEINGQPYRGTDERGDAVHAAIPAIRVALAYVGIAPELDMPPRTLDELAAELVVLQKFQKSASHAQLGALLPAVLEELTVQVMESDAARAWRLLNRAQALAGSLARRLGYNDLAQVVVERTSVSAQRAEDPYLPPLVTLGRARLLMTLGSWDVALKMIKQAASEVDQDNPVSTEVFGSLHLSAAITAARAGKAFDAWEHHGTATEAAARINPRDRRDPYGLQMNPGNASIHGCAVAVELGDCDRAIQLDRGVDLSGRDLNDERRSHHEIDMARAHLWANDNDKALKRMINAERMAPQMVRFHPSARETVRQLGRVHRRIPEPLRALQGRMAV